MLVKEIMQTDVATCAPETPLSAVVSAMWERDCGVLPVVDGRGMVVGVITDRDVAMAACATPHATARMSAKDAMSHPVFSCAAEANVRTILETMAKHHVRRLPVLNPSGHLQGILSIDDIICAPHRWDGPSTEDIVSALKRVHVRPVIEIGSE